MNKDRINTTIDLVLLMLYIVSSIFLCVQISLVNDFSSFMRYILVVLLIILVITNIYSMFVSKDNLIFNKEWVTELIKIYDKHKDNAGIITCYNNLNENI